MNLSLVDNFYYVLRIVCQPKFPIVSETQNVASNTRVRIKCANLTHFQFIEFLCFENRYAATFLLFQFLELVFSILAFVHVSFHSKSIEICSCLHFETKKKSHSIVHVAGVVDDEPFFIAW